MKKTILFLFAAFTLASCSQDDSATTGGDKPTAKVSFEIVSPTFGMDVNPLGTRSGTDEENDYTNSFIQYIFYSSTGMVVLNEIIVGHDLKEVIKEGTFKITAELPVGEYFVAAATGKFDTKNPLPSFIVPEHYYTDGFTPADLSNGNYYYQVVNYTLEPAGGKLALELEPVYAVATLTIENPKTFKVPEGTEEINVCMEPAFKGFWIAHKAGRRNVAEGDRQVKTYKLSDIRNMDSFTTSFVAVASEVEAVAVLEYRKIISGSLETEIIDTLEVKRFNMPENGMSYNIHGSLEEGSSPVGGVNTPLSLSIKEFSGESVDIPL